MTETVTRQCWCGCGQTPRSPGSRFLPGHDSKYAQAMADLHGPIRHPETDPADSAPGRHFQVGDVVRWSGDGALHIIVPVPVGEQPAGRLGQAWTDRLAVPRDSPGRLDVADLTLISASTPQWVRNGRCPSCTTALFAPRSTAEHMVGACSRHGDLILPPGMVMK